LSWTKSVDSSSSAGLLERPVIVLLCGYCSPSIWQKRRCLVRILPGRSIPCPLLCFSAFAEHVCIYLECVFFPYVLDIILITSAATLALSLLLPTAMPVQASLNRIRLAVFLLTVTAIIFRSEVAILLFCHVAYMVVKQIATFGHPTYGITLLRSTAIPAGILGVLAGLCITVPIDTFFWQSPVYLWPELSAFLSNIFPPDSGIGASAWGTQPWHWYFTNALPRLLMRPFIYILLWLMAVSIQAISTPTLDLILPNLAYITVYSFLPHKETRFIFPVVPPLTLAAALSASYIWTRRRRTLLYKFLSLGLGLSTILSALLSHLVLLPFSALSYPGAHALNALHKHASDIQTSSNVIRNTNNTIAIHLDNLSTQTGINRFLQRPCSTKPGSTLWTYDKSDNVTDLLDPFWWTDFDYTIMESPQLAIGSWDVVSVVHGPGSARLLHPHEKWERNDIPTREDKPKHRIDGLDRVALEMYGQPGVWLSVAARRLLREGSGMQWLLGSGWSWTRGWWLDIGWVPKLYVLERRKSLLRDELEPASSPAPQAHPS
jgi:alpha-1,6-mannosyltransferase